MDLTNFIQKTDSQKKKGFDTEEDIEQKKDETELDPRAYLGIPLERLTPGMRQFVTIKKNHLDCVVLFRMGDFYETFYDDAQLVAKELDIVLTARGQGEKRAPLAGIPYHSLEPYLAKLVKRGHKVAIVEQLEDPKKAKGIVKRGVVRIVTPGTVIESTMLDDKSNNYIMSLYVHSDNCSVSLCDISTGEFVTTQVGIINLSHLLVRFNPAECIVPMSLTVNREIIDLLKQNDVFVNPYDDRYFRKEFAHQILTDHFKTMSLEGFGLRDTLQINSSGALLHYLSETQKTNLSYINNVRVFTTDNTMLLDAHTIRNLELTHNIRDRSSTGTLLNVLDKTKTSMGSRLLRKLIKEPLLDLEKIKARHDAVSWLKNQAITRQDIILKLERMQDVERLISRINYGSSNARDLLALKKSFMNLPYIKSLLDSKSSPLLSDIKNMPDVSSIVELIETSIKEEPAAITRDGNMIKTGFNPDLDKLHTIKKNSKITLKNMEEKEKEKTGIKTLKIKFNNVFGYFFEVSKSYIKDVPDHYIRKQTMTNAERYITPELKEQEDLILNADEKIKVLEFELFQKVVSQIAEKTTEIQKVSKHIAQLDFFVSLSSCAADYGFVKPIMDESSEVILKNSRHPVIERLEKNFVPNDVHIKKNEMMILTGPNMAGKSTFMRQVALTSLLAQIGSFVPAEYAKLGIVDRIFTRVGATDDLTTGQSTFMVEMNETAYILNNATEKSLIILDEIGRGTSTFDGVSIAWSVAEYITEKIKAKTLFATHYHVLNKLCEKHESITNYTVCVKEDGHDIVFLHKIIKGSTDKSYGVHVARLAGMPTSVIERAVEMQKKFLDEDQMVSKIIE